MQCFLTVAGFLIIGRTFSLLHLLPSLAGFLSVIFLLWTNAMRELRTNSKIRAKLSATMKLVSRFWKSETELSVPRANPSALTSFALAAASDGFSKRPFLTSKAAAPKEAHGD